MNKKGFYGSGKDNLFLTEKDFLQVTCYFTLKQPEKAACQKNQVFYFKVLNSDGIILEKFCDYIVSELIIKGFCQIQSSRVKWEFIHLKLVCKTNTLVYLKKLENIYGRVDLKLNDSLQNLEFKLNPLLGRIPKVFDLDGVPNTLYCLFLSNTREATRFDSPLARITKFLTNPICDENNQYRFLMPSTEFIIGFDFIISVQLDTYSIQIKRNLFFRVFFLIPAILLFGIAFSPPPANSTEMLPRVAMVKDFETMSICCSGKIESGKNPFHSHSTFKRITVKTQSSRNIKKAGLVNTANFGGRISQSNHDYANLLNLLRVNQELHALTSNDVKELKEKIYNQFSTDRRVNSEQIKDIEVENESRDYYLNTLLDEELLPVVKSRGNYAYSIISCNTKSLTEDRQSRLDTTVRFQDEPEDLNLRMKGKLAWLINDVALQQSRGAKRMAAKSAFVRDLLDESVISAADITRNRIKRTTLNKTEASNNESALYWICRPRSRAVQNKRYNNDTIKWHVNKCDLFVFNQLTALMEYKHFRPNLPDWSV